MSRVTTYPLKSVSSAPAWAGLKRLSGHRLLCGCIWLVALLGFVLPGSAQSNEWAWMGGSKSPVPGAYGQLGTPAAGNMPGARISANTWMDSNGKLWLFGGDAIDSNHRYGELNDLWVFDSATGEWAWMGGSNSIDNAAVESGVYGVQGKADAANLPPARKDAASWTDIHGNFWLFGGQRFAYGSYNDLWQYNVSTSQWTWVKGSNMSDQPAVFGTMGVAASGNTPAALIDPAIWVDKQGNLWLFGGQSPAIGGATAYLNQLWKFDLNTNQWAWMGGNNVLGSGPPYGYPGIYGTRGVPSAANIPGARKSATTWTDDQGKLWLYGGHGMDSAGVEGTLDDLWVFDLSTNQWTWMAGTTTFAGQCGSSYIGPGCGTPGTHGVMQVPDAQNYPGSRETAVGWKDRQGNFWLFGGWGPQTNGKWGGWNDLWKFDLKTGVWTWMSGADDLNCAYVFCGYVGVFGTMGTPDLGNSPSGRQMGFGWTDAKGNFWLFGGYGNNVSGVSTYLQDLWEFQPNTNSLQIAETPVFSPRPGSYTSVQTVEISDATPGATISYLIDGNTPAQAYTGPITLQTSHTIQAIASAPGYGNSNITTGQYAVDVPIATAPVFSLPSGNYDATQSVSLSDMTPGAAIFYTTDGSMPTTSSSQFTGAIAVNSSETILAVAVAPGFLNSPVSAAVYNMGTSTSENQWTWVGGTNQENSPGVYGTLGVASAANVPGGRDGAASWTDASGKFWLFGGSGVDANGNLGVLNDLWKFDPAARLWTWMGGPSTLPACETWQLPCGQKGIYGTQGTPSTANYPGSRSGGSAWVDSIGHVWLMGGYGADSTGSFNDLNDLWEFNPATGEWTWVKGYSAAIPNYYNGMSTPGVYGLMGVAAPGNMPGGRSGFASWRDSKGRFWLFGGNGQDFTGRRVSLNDLWMFDTQTRNWTWIGGSYYVDPITTYQPGSYGPLGVEGEQYSPGSRQGAAGWVDANDNLWMFGGYAGSANGDYNDLWRYNIATNKWAWMGGKNTFECRFDPVVGFPACTTAPNKIGTLGIPGSTDVPGGGNSFQAWTDSKNNFWLFGGISPDVTGQTNGFYTGPVNAMWTYLSSINEWRWMGGDTYTSNCSWIVTYFVYPVCLGSPGNFGTLGVSAAANLPPARYRGVNWTDKDGNFWLFSGQITDLSYRNVETNDLWVYRPASTLPNAATPIISLMPSNYLNSIQVQLANGMSNGQIYYTTDGTTPTNASTPYTGVITLNASATLKALGTAAGYKDSNVASASYTIVPVPATPVISLTPGTYSAVQTVTLTDATPNAFIFYSFNFSDPIPGWTQYTGPIVIAKTETLTAVAAVPSTANLEYAGIAYPSTGEADSLPASATYVINLPAAAAPTFSVPGGTYDKAQSVALNDATPGATIYYTLDGSVPTDSSYKYSTPIPISSSRTLQAIATADGYSPSAVAVATYTINLAKDFLISASPAALTIARGQSGQTTIAIVPQNGFTADVSFACSGLPAGVACVFSPATVSLAAGAASTSLTITTPATSAAMREGPKPWWPAPFLAATVLCWGFKARRRLWRVALMLGAVTVALGFVSACGGGGSSGPSGGGTGPVNATVTIMATSGSIQHSTNVSVTIR